MKVLFLNPHVREDHPLVKGLQSRGLAVLVAANSKEASQLFLLHGSNVDLLIVHREDESSKDNEGGFKFVAKIKSNPQHADLPMIISSQRWGDAEFARHQETLHGANAYIKWPYDVDAIYALIGAVFGGEVPSSDASRTVARGELEKAASKAPVAPPAKGQPPKVPPPMKSKVPQPPVLQSPPAVSDHSISLGTGGSGGLVLEDASSLFSRNDQKSNGDTSIRLEMPDNEFPTGVTSAPVVAESGVAIEVPLTEGVGIAIGPADDAPASFLQDSSVEALLDAAPGEAPSIPDAEPTNANVEVGAIEFGAGATSQPAADGFEVHDGRTTVGLPAGISSGDIDAGNSEAEIHDGKTTVGIPAGLEAIGMEAGADIHDGKTTVGMPTGMEIAAAPAEPTGMDIHDGNTTVGMPDGLDFADIHDGKTTVGLPDGLAAALKGGRELVQNQNAGFGQESSSTVIETPSLAITSERTSIQENTSQQDTDAAQQMPYLYPEGANRPAAAAAAFALPLGDAVVPGGAANAPDVETLKKYLLLREQDVAVLCTQLKAARDQLKTMEGELRMERAKNSELTHVTFEQKRKLDEAEKDKQHALESAHSEMNDVRFQLKAKADKSRVLESQVRESAEEIERLKERVRTDIRKIRVREKELENRLEIVKKDSEALISARENKIIELKRKLDLLEFNMDLLQDQHARERETASKLRERLAKAAQVVRVAGGLLDNPAGASQLAAVLSGDVDDEIARAKAKIKSKSEDAA